MNCTASLAASLSSISSEIDSCSVAGPALTTSRATPSSRTVKSVALRPVTGLPLLSTTLT